MTEHVMKLKNLDLLHRKDAIGKISRLIIAIAGIAVVCGLFYIFLNYTTSMPEDKADAFNQMLGSIVGSVFLTIINFGFVCGLGLLFCGDDPTECIAIDSRPLLRKILSIILTIVWVATSIWLFNGIEDKSPIYLTITVSFCAAGIVYFIFMLIIVKLILPIITWIIGDSLCAK
jgi:hypothetical protein